MFTLQVGVVSAVPNGSTSIVAMPLSRGTGAEAVVKSISSSSVTMCSPLLKCV
jgi:hypothetical protein